MSQARFQKRQREMARMEKAKAKAARREERQEAAAEAAAAPKAVVDHDAVIAELAALHKKFDDEAINFEDFEEAKQELLAKLQV